MFFSFISFVLSVVSIILSVSMYAERKKEKKKTLPPLKQDMPPLHPKQDVTPTPLKQDPDFVLAQRPSQSELPPISSFKNKQKKREGESFIGKNVLSILATIMITIGAICLGALAGNEAKVLLILFAGVGIGVFGYLGKETPFRVSCLACGEVLTLISLMLSGILYKLISAEIFLLLSVAFAVVCSLLTIKKKHPVLSFASNIGLLITSMYFASTDLKMGLTALIILAVISFSVSMFTKKNLCAINLFLTNIMFATVIANYESTIAALVVFVAMMVFEFAYFKHFGIHWILNMFHVATWTLLHFIVLEEFAWHAFVKDEYIFKNNVMIAYALISLVLIFVATKLINLIKKKDDILLDLGLFGAFFVPFLFSVAFDGNWFITETSRFNFLAVVLFGIPGLCFILGFAPKRNKVYTAVGASLLALLAVVIPRSENGGSLFVSGLKLGETGAFIWAIGAILVFVALNAFLRYKGEENKFATFISVLGAYLSTLSFETPRFAILTVIVTLIVSAAQYYLWNFRISLYVLSHIFDVFILSVIMSSSSTKVEAALLFLLAQTAMIFTVKKAMDTGRVYLWITSLLRLNLFIMIFSGAVGADAVGFVMSGILLLVAATLIVLGFRFKLKTVRVFGLWELIAVVAKMCLIDISGENTVTRVVAFIGGGVLCLIISALYGKYEKETIAEPQSTAADAQNE